MFTGFTQTMRDGAHDWATRRLSFRRKLGLYLASNLFMIGFLSWGVPDLVCVPLSIFLNLVCGDWIDRFFVNDFVNHDDENIVWRTTKNA